MTPAAAMTGVETRVDASVPLTLPLFRANVLCAKDTRRPKASWEETKRTPVAHRGFVCGGGGGISIRAGGIGAAAPATRTAAKMFVTAALLSVAQRRSSLTSAELRTERRLWTPMKPEHAIREPTKQVAELLCAGDSHDALACGHCVNGGRTSATESRTTTDHDHMFSATARRPGAAAVPSTL